VKIKSCTPFLAPCFTQWTSDNTLIAECLQSWEHCKKTVNPSNLQFIPENSNIYETDPIFEVLTAVKVQVLPDYDAV